MTRIEIHREGTQTTVLGRTLTLLACIIGVTGITCSAAFAEQIFSTPEFTTDGVNGSGVNLVVTDTTSGESRVLAEVFKPEEGSIRSLEYDPVSRTVAAQYQIGDGKNIEFAYGIRTYSADTGEVLSDVTLTPGPDNGYGRTAPFYTLPPDNAGQVKTNTSQIQQNTQVTKSNSSNIAKNSTRIDTNTTNIAKNTENIAALSNDVSGLQSQVDQLARRDRRLTEGLAAVASLAQPILLPGQHFAMRAGWGGFDDASALSFTAAGVLASNLLGQGRGTLVADGGVGVGTRNGEVAGRAGLTVGW